MCSPITDYVTKTRSLGSILRFKGRVLKLPECFSLQMTIRGTMIPKLSHNQTYGTLQIHPDPWKLVGSNINP